MTCFRFILAFLLASFSFSHVRAEQPNVLILFADDMRADSVGALGNPVIRTPNLDQLVRSGIAFENAYCLGGNSGAVCTPSRLPSGEPIQGCE